MDPQLQFGICYAVITMFCMVFSVMMLLRTTTDIGSEREIFYFRGIVISFIVFCATDAIWCLGNFGILPVPTAAMYVLSAVSTACLAFACFFWYCYGEARLGGAAVNQRWKVAIAACPLVVLLGLYATTYWTSLVFYYADVPTYRMQQGPLYASSIALMALYIFTVSIHSAVRAAKEKAPTLRREYLSFVAFAVTPIAAGVFDAFVPDMPVIAPSLFTSVLLVFLTLQESQIYNDSLTALNNRRRADDYLAEAVADASEEQPLTLFMIDVNSFKAINDSKGHVEGDRALRTVAEGIRQACDETRSFAARWGGDEFMVVAESGQIGSPDAFVAQLEAAVARECAVQQLGYDLSISAGYSQCSDPSTRPGAVVARADEALYAQKQRLHAQQGKQGVA